MLLDRFCVSRGRDKTRIEVRTGCRELWSIRGTSGLLRIRYTRQVAEWTAAGGTDVLSRMRHPTPGLQYIRLQQTSHLAHERAMCTVLVWRDVFLPGQ